MNKKLENEIMDFCKINDLEPDAFMEKCLITGFNIAKYGHKPAVNPKYVKIKIPTEGITSSEEITIKKTIQKDDYDIYDNK